MVFFIRKRWKTILIFELTLAPINNILIYSDTTKAPSYSIKNLELEYSSISSEYLAREAQAAYQVGKGFFYENITLHKTFTFSIGGDGVINQHINLPRRSMTGILFLFLLPQAAGARDSENFYNPGISSVEIDVDGVPNRIYSRGMIPSDLWESVKKRFHRDDGLQISLKEKEFYADKFALWVDTRTHPDNGIHGGGLGI